MSERIPFSPQYDTGSTTVTGTSQALQVNPDGVPGVSVLDVRLIGGTAAAFIRFGNIGITVSAANGFPIVPNSQRLLSIGGYTHMAVIGTDGVFYVTRGQGNV